MWNPAFVQTVNGSTGGADPTWTTAYSGNVTAGNILAGLFAPAAVLVSVTDSQGNVWTQQKAVGTLSLWTAIAGSSGPCTVTTTVSTGSIATRLLEFTPDGATSIVQDVSSSATTAGVNSHAPGSITPAVADTLIIFAIEITGGYGVTSGPADYTLHGTTVDPIAYSRIMATPAAHNPTLVTSSIESTRVMAVAFAAVTGGGGGGEEVSAVVNTVSLGAVMTIAPDAIVALPSRTVIMFTTDTSAYERSNDSSFSTVAAITFNSNGQAVLSGGFVRNKSVASSNAIFKVSRRK